MKLISWNVNGIRACVQKGFLDFFHEADADIFCIQETKMQEGQLNLELEGYYQYWNYAVKKGYSGTAVFTKKEPLSVSYGIGIEEHDQEGRVITCEFEEFYFVTVYTPNSQNGLARLDYRMKWEDDFRAYVCALDQKKPGVICGDMNDLYEAFRRMCFNIFYENKDDHGKNFSFLYDEKRRMYCLSPAYDLTQTPNKPEHEMTVRGNGNPTEKDLIAVSKELNLSLKRCIHILETVKK